MNVCYCECVCAQWVNVHKHVRVCVWVHSSTVITYSHLSLSLAGVVRVFDVCLR